MPNRSCSAGNIRFKRRKFDIAPLFYERSTSRPQTDSSPRGDPEQIKVLRRVVASQDPQVWSEWRMQRPTKHIKLAGGDLRSASVPDLKHGNSKLQDTRYKQAPNHKHQITSTKFQTVDYRSQPWRDQQSRARLSVSAPRTQLPRRKRTGTILLLSPTKVSSWNDPAQPGAGLS